MVYQNMLLKTIDLFIQNPYMLHLSMIDYYHLIPDALPFWNSPPVDQLVIELRLGLIILGAP